MSDKAELQYELENLHAKNHLLNRMKQDFVENESIDFVSAIQNIGLDEEFGIDLLAKMALHKRVDVPALVGLMRHHFDTAQECMDALYVATDNDLIDWDFNFKTFVMKWDISSQTKRDLEMFQYPLPMVVKPLELTKNTDSGYLTWKASVILKDNFTHDDVCLDHLNRVNGIGLQVDMKLANQISNSWKGLDKLKQGETVEEFKSRRRAFEKYDRTARAVMAAVVSEGNEFYLTHAYDKRGRVYCRGYHINYQGGSWNKAVIQFKEGVHVEMD